MTSLDPMRVYPTAVELVRVRRQPDHLQAILFKLNILNLELSIVVFHKANFVAPSAISSEGLPKADERVTKRPPRIIP